MGRIDHCFLLKTRDGQGGMAFCRAEERDVEQARGLASSVLEGEERFAGARLAYLGVLDYGQMEGSAADGLSAFLRRDPVWLVLFDRAGAGPT